MAILVAACGGDAVKLFDAESCLEGRADSCVSHFTPAPSCQVNCVRWNHTNLVVASSGEDRKISLWLKGGKLLGSVPQADDDAGENLDESILAMNFCSKGSRYLCSGGTGKIVRIWDMQRKRCIKWLKGHVDTITGVMYNCRDEHLASISTHGDLIVHSLTSGSRVIELKDPQNQVLRALDYSHSSRHLIVTAGDDGSVHLWDTSGRSPKVSWIKQHLAPTTGICFSTNSDKMIVSVGLDKRLYTYDINSKKPVYSISGDAPFSSLAFQDDGWTVAAGTNNGRIAFYDVRGKTQALTTLRCFASQAVQSISWQRANPVEVGNASKCSADTALLGTGSEDSVVMPDPVVSARRGFSAKNYTRDKPPLENSQQQQQQQQHQQQQQQQQHQHQHQQQQQQQLQQIQKPQQQQQSSWSNGSYFRHHSSSSLSGMDDMEVFSPLADVQPIAPPLSTYWDGATAAYKRSLVPTDSSSSSSSSLPKLSPPQIQITHTNITNNNNNNTTPTPSLPPLSQDKSVSPALSTPSSDVIGIGKSPSVTPPEAWGGENLNAKRTQMRSSDLFSAPAAASTAAAPPTAAATGGRSINVSRKFLQEHIPSENGNVAAAAENNGHAAASSPTAFSSSAAAASGFAVQLVQKALEESIGSMQRAIHEDVHNLHLDLLRQFHIQHKEMSSMIDMLTAKQNLLMEEVKELRKENQHLQHLL